MQRVNAVVIKGRFNNEQMVRQYIQLHRAGRLKGAHTHTQAHAREINRDRDGRLKGAARDQIGDEDPCSPPVERAIVVAERRAALVRAELPRLELVVRAHTVRRWSC